MQISNFFYKLFIIDKNNKPSRFAGSAVPITPNGGLITCRHVVELESKTDELRLAVYDNEINNFVEIGDIYISDNKLIDLAFIPNAFHRPKTEYLPILEPDKILIGESIYSFGYFAFGGRLESITQGYFSGRIVNIFKNKEKGEFLSLILPYPIIEGMSGSAVLTYHNGPKLVGICYGNQSQRIVASEVIEYEAGEEKYKETISRIVEFGLAYHASALIDFLKSISNTDFTITDQTVKIPGLE